MIFGLGSDIVNIPRIEKILEGGCGQRFLARVFTQAEIAGAPTHSRSRAAYFAKRFAAKEAFAKALGTGFRNGVRFADVEVVKASNGKPSLRLYNVAAAQLGEKQVHLSLSDDYPMAMAVLCITHCMTAV